MKQFAVYVFILRTMGGLPDNYRFRLHGAKSVQNTHLTIKMKQKEGMP